MLSKGSERANESEARWYKGLDVGAGNQLAVKFSAISKLSVYILSRISRKE